MIYHNNFYHVCVTRATLRFDFPHRRLCSASYDATQNNEITGIQLRNAYKYKTKRPAKMKGRQREKVLLATLST